jgi:hypothetical protein
LQRQANQVSKMPGLNDALANQRFASCGKGARILAGTGASMPGTMYADGYRTSLGRHGGYSISLPGINHTKGYPGILIYICGNEHYVPKNLLLNCASESVSPL